jgi:undecaprenyl-diphosphatase
MLQPSAFTNFSLPLLTQLLSAMAIADLLTGIAYLLLKKYPFVHDSIPMKVGILISALALLSLLFCSFGNNKQVNLTHAAVIGLAQSFALFPGISRLAATIVAASWLGIDPLQGGLFSLIIEFPLIAAAITKEIIRSPYAARSFYALSLTQFLTLTASTLLSSILLIGVIMMHVHHILYLFGWYLLALVFYIAARAK